MQRRLQPVVVGAGNVEVIVDDHARQLLAACPRHELGLALVELKAFLSDDLPNRRSDRVARDDENLSSGEGEVVCVAAIGRAEARCEAREAAVEAIRGEIRERGRSRCTLRQVGTRQPCA